MTLLEAVKLVKEYDRRQVLKEVSLKIERGETFALIGSTGAGKTTLLKLLDLLETPSSGSIYFDGVDVTNSQHEQLKARRRMSLVQQKPIVFTMNVYDNVACGLKWRHEKSQIVRLKVERALALVGMSEYRNRNAKTLSGGETQRVAIARALITDPEMLFLDEPTANLDPVSTSKIEQVLANIIQEGRTTVVMATHDMSQAQRLGSRIGVLINGEIPQVGSPHEIFCSPQNKEVAEFVGIENILSGLVVNRNDNLLTVDVNGNAIEVVSDCALGDRVYVLIRPEDITLTLAKETSSARNILESTITRLTLVEPLMRIEVNCGFFLLAVVTRNSAQELDLTVGKRVYASFKATAVHVIRRWS